MQSDPLNGFMFNKMSAALCIGSRSAQNKYCKGVNKILTAKHQRAVNKYMEGGVATAYDGDSQNATAATTPHPTVDQQVSELLPLIFKNLAAPPPPPPVPPTWPVAMLLRMVK